MKPKNSSGGVRNHRVFIVDDHPHCGHPLIESKRRVFKDRSNLRAELALWVAALALPLLLLLKEAHVIAATSRTYNTVRPRSRNKVLKTILRIGKIEDCFLQSVWAVGFALHREMNLS